MRSKRLVPRPETDVKLTAIQLGLLSVGAVGYAVAAQGVGSLRVPFLVSGIALATVAAIVLPRYLRLRRESGMTPSLVRPFVTFDEMKRTMSPILMLMVFSFFVRARRYNFFGAERTKLPGVWQKSGGMLVRVDGKC